MSKKLNFLVLLLFAVLFLGCTSPPQKNDAGIANELPNASIDTTYRCPNGSIVAKIGDCKAAQSIKVYECPSGRFVTDLQECNETSNGISQETTGWTTGCRGGNLIDGKCVCNEPNQQEVNGACQSRFCIINWEERNPENVSPGACSNFYANATYNFTRYYCNPETMKTESNCEICGCRKGLQCVDGACQYTDKEKPKDAVIEWEKKTVNNIEIEVKEIHPNETVDFEIRRYETWDKITLEPGHGIAKKFALGYANVSLDDSYYGRGKQSWALISILPYATECIAVNESQTIMVYRYKGDQGANNKLLVKKIANDSIILVMTDKVPQLTYNLSAANSTLPLLNGKKISICSAGSRMGLEITTPDTLDYIISSKIGIV